MTELREIGEADRAQVAAYLRGQWGSDRMAVHGRLFVPAELPGFGIWDEGAIVGLVTYEILGDACEVVTLNSSRRLQGVGTRLMVAVVDLARRSGLRRVWLVTTNDNVNALRFYQKRGFVLAALRPGAIEESRRLKPEIPLYGQHGIPIRDELELELMLE